MKRISNRMIFLIVLIVILALGMAFFFGNYLINAHRWIIFSGSPHVYTGTNLSYGTVFDRNETMLLDSSDGRSYSVDVDLRKSTLHLLGDRYGYISAPVLEHYADKLVGFDVINGIYSLVDTANEAHLTINADVQKAAQSALNGRKGTIGVYNYRTGEIICAVSAPTYDPDNVPDIDSDQTGAYDGVYLNRFFQTTYVPGSIYKCVTAAAALETIPDAADRTYYCGGFCQIGGDTVNCNGIHGNVDLKGALANSCNVYFGLLAIDLGQEVLEEYAEKLGITSSLSFDGITTVAGNYNLSDAAQSQIAWSGIGQHTNLINACQFLTVMGAIANGGQAAKPYLMDSVTSALGKGYEARTEELTAVLDRQTCDQLAELMRNNVVTKYGQWQFPDLYVCAKSGTAELGPNETPHATFAGFIQDDQFPLAFIVIVEHGGSGSATCAPIAGAVLNACVAALS